MLAHPVKNCGAMRLVAVTLLLSIRLGWSLQVCALGCWQGKCCLMILLLVLLCTYRQAAGLRARLERGSLDSASVSVAPHQLHWTRRNEGVTDTL